MQDFSFLTQSPIFVGFKPDELGAIIRNSRSVRVKAGHVFIRAGARNASMYIIASGRVTVERQAGNRTIELARLERGQSFGEMSLLGPMPASATLTAETETEALVVSSRTLEKLLGHSPALWGKLWRNLAFELRSRLIHTNDLVVETRRSKRLRDAMSSFVARLRTRSKPAVS